MVCGNLEVLRLRRRRRCGLGRRAMANGRRQMAHLVTRDMPLAVPLCDTRSTVVPQALTCTRNLIGP